ncbi:hypothetical protein ACJ6WD_39920 [Streptomyces sp. VTCC 41912]|uniref:hypothetical protein n=1 Tax=Streptomyces sp. VTCC 41912 TaxID=3383243 RepID=UPI003896A2D0
MSDHYQPRPCDNCGGTRGNVRTRLEMAPDGRQVQRDEWESCGPCQGTGVR